MMQYDFDPGFWNPIARGEKISTLRNMRTRPRRHARLGEALELYALVDGRRLQIIKAQCVKLEGVFLHLAAGIVNVGPIERNRSTWSPLKPKARKDLALRTGHAGGWKQAAAFYSQRYGDDPWSGTLVTWGPREYDGPIPSAPQLRDLKILRDRADASPGSGIIPMYGKISTGVAHALVVMRWAEVLELWMKADGSSPIKITQLGRWILERFEK